MTTPETTPKMLSIWFLVGIILAVYGLILTGCGAYYHVHPELLTQKLGELNPSLWWGAGMTGLGALFLVFGR